MKERDLTVKNWLSVSEFPTDIAGLSQEEHQVALKAVQKLRSNRLAEDFPDIAFDIASDIPPFSIVFRGATYNHSRRQNPLYRKFREQLRQFADNETTPCQLGRVAARLVQGRMPREGFIYAPSQGITYTGEAPYLMTVEGLGAKIGEETAAHIIAMFEKMTSAQE